MMACFAVAAASEIHAALQRLAAAAAIERREGGVGAVL